MVLGIIGVGDAENNQDVGNGAVSNKDLVPVDDIIPAVLLCHSGHRDHIAPRIRLRDRHSHPHFP